jgi:hypothetical protein
VAVGFFTQGLKVALRLRPRPWELGLKAQLILDIRRHMNPSDLLRHTRLLPALFLTLITIDASAALVSSGYPVKNRKWETLVTDYGYADLALDRRKGFKGREYLSGEWAAAVHYSGGRNPTGPIWLQPQWFFPDWVSNSDFGVFKPFGVSDPMNPTNSYGYTVYSSSITNRDLRITITYEMVRFGTNETEQLVIGLTPKSSGTMVPYLTSGKYAFRQRYQLENISGGTLNNVRFYQLLHGLESGKGVYDDRDYGGGMSMARYGITHQGTSFSFDTRTMETVEHTDSIAMKFSRMPSGYALGPYGIKGVDSHEVGKPSTGIHIDIENDVLNGTDFYDVGSTGYVAGAMKFDLGTISAGATMSISAMLAIHTEYEVKHPPLDLVIHRTGISNGNYVIDFEEKTQNPVVGYGLYKTTVLDGIPYENWEPQPVPYYINVPQPGWKRFEVPVESDEPSAYYYLRPQVFNF